MTTSAPEDPFVPFAASVDTVIATVPTAASVAAPLAPALVDELDAAASAAFEASLGTPGAVVGVRTRAGTWTKAYGLADPGTGSPMSTGVRLRIGSVTKTFTGTLFLRLVEEGRLSLDDRISAYVPGVPNGDRITLALLASMRSGVASYTANGAFVGRVLADLSAPFSPADVIDAGLAVSPAFEPDARFDYSNTNFALLGQVIEHVTGQPIGVLLEQRIFEPLDLANTSWPGDSCAIPAPHAEGFTLSAPSASPEHPANATHWNPAWAGAAGAIISTVDDLLAYARAVVTGQGLLGHEAQARRLRSFRPAPQFGDGVAYGLALMSIGSWVGHSGDIPGYRTSMYHEPTADTTLVVLTSSDIVSGRCPEAVAEATIPSEAPCCAPNARIFDAVSHALGLPAATPHPE